MSSFVNGVRERMGDSGPLLASVGPDLEHDPPHSFQTEEACEDYFEGRERDPTLVSFAPVPEEHRKAD